VSPGQLLADLNRYWTDCTGAAGAAGHADLAFRFPFAKGVTEILLNPHTYAFAGYASGPAQTLMTQQAVVSGPGVLP
jgi:hypothetical protein